MSVEEFGEVWNRQEALDWVAWAIESRVDDRVLRVVRDSTEFFLQDHLEDVVLMDVWNQMEKPR